MGIYVIVYAEPVGILRKNHPESHSRKKPSWKEPKLSTEGESVPAFSREDYSSDLTDTPQFRRIRSILVPAQGKEFSKWNHHWGKKLRKNVTLQQELLKDLIAEVSLVRSNDNDSHYIGKLWPSKGDGYSGRDLIDLTECWNLPEAISSFVSIQNNHVSPSESYDWQYSVPGPANVPMGGLVEYRKI